MTTGFTKLAIVFALGAAVAGCGIDGPPQRPAQTVVVKPGVTVTGDAQFGMRNNAL